MKQYPLEVQSVGEDVYIVMSKGHHDLTEFMRAALLQYDWPLGSPQQMWMRAVPQRDGSCIYVETSAGARGAFPATYCWERFGEERWISALSKTGREWIGMKKDMPPYHTPFSLADSTLRTIPE